MKGIAICLATYLILCISSCSGQNEFSNQKIHWMSFQQAVKANEKQPKKIFIDVYTSWCGWCKKMDASTFMNDSVSNYMNEKFYAVKLDAEMKDSVVYNNYTFRYKPEYKANELALSLLQSKMSYPTFVVMDEKFSLLSPVPGYQTAPQLMPILKYFGENIYLNKNWEDYVKSISQ